MVGNAILRRRRYATQPRPAAVAAALGNSTPTWRVRYPAAMPQSLSNVLVHLVFSTKERHPFLANSTLRVAMHRYLATVSAELRCPVVTVGGVADHVHLLARQARTITLAGWVRELKRTSSLWLKQRPDGPEGFQWQAGYGAKSVAARSRAALHHTARSPPWPGELSGRAAHLAEAASDCL